MVNEAAARERLPRWYDAESPEGHPKYERASVVESVLLGADPAHVALLQRLEERMSRAVGEAQQWVKDRLTVTVGEDPTGATRRDRLLAADLQLAEGVVSALPSWIGTLLAETPGAAAVSKLPEALRLAWGEIREVQEGDKRVRRWKALHRSPRLQLQQFFLKVLPAAVVGRPPKPLQPGMTQEVAQQLCSHLMLVDSGAVRLAAFPTVEDRDPRRRRTAWEEALERVCRRAAPFPYVRARELNPARYDAGDPKGNRLVNADPDWHDVARTPEAPHTPLLYVSGQGIRLLRRIWRRSGCQDSDSERSARGTYVALPVDAEFLDSLDPALRAAADWWRPDEIRAQFAPILPAHQPLKPRDVVLVIPLSYGRKRTERRVLPALQRLPIQWGRIVHRFYRRGEERERWFLQLTIGYAAPMPFPDRVLGVHFGLENVCYWALLEDRGPGVEPLLLEEGHVTGNPMLKHGLAEKEGLEWDQRKGRWVGGAVYAPALRGSTHGVVDAIIRLARAKSGTDGVPAGLGLERIRWVPKGAGPADANRRFSAWNYGQLPTFLGYKAPAASIWVTEITLTKPDRKQADVEQARRLARIAIRRLHERRRRAEEAARRAAEEEGGETDA